MKQAGVSKQTGNTAVIKGTVTTWPWQPSRQEWRSK